MELKARPKVDARDATTIEKAQRVLGDRYRGGLIVYRGDRVVRLTDSVFAVPDWMLLGIEAPQRSYSRYPGAVSVIPGA